MLDALPAAAAQRLPAGAAQSKSSSSTTHRLFAHANGPRTAVSYKGNFLAGVAFEVTTGGCWLEGFWWWVCHRGQSTREQKFALWQAYTLSPTDGGLEGTLIRSATIESKRLRPGRWNYIPLHKPVPLAIGATYVAATGFRNGFPITKHSFGKGERYGRGIKSGPLLAFSDQGGLRPVPYGGAQALYGVSSDDPAKHMPAIGDGSHSNFWVDLQISTKAPKGASYRLWPSFPSLPAPADTAVSLDTLEQSMGTEFWLSESCSLDKIWYYSPPGAKILPSQCAIWEVSSQNIVSGTLKTSPGWSGAAASGWVSSSYSGITLPAGKYKTTAYSPGGQPFFAETAFYFGDDISDKNAPGPASASGISTGPLYSPNLKQASVAEANGSTSVPAGTLVPANSTYQDNTSDQAGQFLYPYSFDNKDNGESRWVDVEVTPG